MRVVADQVIIVACYYLLGVSAAVTPILMPFVNMALRDDAEARAITVGAMVCHPPEPVDPNHRPLTISLVDVRMGSLLLLPHRRISRC